jgi:RNA polymerase sigma factor (sigma-70 family)
MATLPSPPNDLTPEQLFLGHLKLIEEIIAHAARKSHFGREEAEDFSGWVMVKLIEDNYGVFRQYRGKCSLKTYLTVVIGRLLLDYKNHIWGKHRAPAEAKRSGAVAIRLDVLLFRDGYTFDEACQILRTNEKVEMSVEELADLRAKLTAHGLRHFVGEERLQTEPSRDLRPDERIEEKERAGKGRRIIMALHRALATLSKDDQVLLRMRSELSVADIARVLRVEQKPLYRRLEKIYKKLEKALERQGVRRQDVEEILGSLEPDLLDF